MTESIDPALFRETLGNYPTGVAVVTASTEDGTVDGMVVGTFSSVSLDPPLVAFFPAKSSKSFERLRNAASFCVNVLAADQEPLCRRISTVREGKFDGASWRPGTLGSPILDGAVSWVECTFEEVREAGDHYVVLGRVHAMGVERPTLPLLFFQGGYGRFSPRSFIAAPEPGLIQAAQLAEAIRAPVEQLSAELGVNCGVLAKIGSDAVQVLASDRNTSTEAFALGHRQPIIPPFGAVFMVNSTPEEVDEWLARVPQGAADRRELNRGILEKVRQQGYSLLAVDSERMRRHVAALNEFEQSDRLPRNERAVREATAELADLFCPDLEPGGLYHPASIVVLIPTGGDLPPMALRMTGLPHSATTEQIESWVQSLKRVADLAANPPTHP